MRERQPARNYATLILTVVTTCKYVYIQVEKGNWNGLVKGLGKDVPDALSPKPM